MSSRISTDARLWNKLLFAILGAWNILKQRNMRHFDSMDYGAEYSELTWLTMFPVDIDNVGVRIKLEFTDQMFAFIISENLFPTE